jgi:hypothetical protein
MSKTKQQLMEELENFRKNKKLVPKIIDNKVNSFIIQILEDFGFPVNDYNLGVAKQGIEFFAGFTFINSLHDDKLRKNYIKSCMITVISDFKEKHEFTPLWKMLNSND